MPLRVTHGIPIIVPLPQAGLTLENVFESTTSLTLPLLRSEQEAGAWCYAACAEMVINYSHQQQLTNQCQVVSFVKKGEDQLNFCCTTNGNECTESGCKVRDIGAVFDFWKIDHETSGNAADPVLGPVTLARLTAEFAAKRPVEVVVEWDDDGAHAVLVTGVQGEMVFVVDPLEDEPYGGWQTVFSLEEGFGFGTWSRTWPGLRRL